MLHRTAATVVPELDFVVLVAIALHFPGRRGAHSALDLVHRAVEIVIVPDIDVHGVVEGTRTPHVRVHANARLRTGRHQDDRSENRLHVDGVEMLFGWMLLMSIVVGGRILMELADMSSVSKLERLDSLYIISVLTFMLYTLPCRSASVIRTNVFLRRNSSLRTLLVFHAKMHRLLQIERLE